MRYKRDGWNHHCLVKVPPVTRDVDRGKPQRGQSTTTNETTAILHPHSQPSPTSQPPTPTTKLFSGLLQLEAYFKENKLTSLNITQYQYRLATLYAYEWHGWHFRTQTSNRRSLPWERSPTLSRNLLALTFLFIIVCDVLWMIQGTSLHVSSL